LSQLNVALAPHLVRPLPLVVPAFDGARPDRLTGIGLNMYDVMSTAVLADELGWDGERTEHEAAAFRAEAAAEGVVV
jgi:glycerol-3-phosphate dehydrogenase